MNNLTIFGDISLATKKMIYAIEQLLYVRIMLGRCLTLECQLLASVEGYRVIVLTQFDGFENSVASLMKQGLIISGQGINPLSDSFIF